MSATVIHTRCWHCGYECNRASPTDGISTPSDGDASVCFQCGKLALFDSTIPDGVRKPSPKEYEELRAQDDIHQMLLSWHRYKQQEQRAGTKR